jgi:hypothetical protein
MNAGILAEAGGEVNLRFIGGSDIDGTAAAADNHAQVARIFIRERFLASS